jgi:hypothetical protein
VLARLATLNSPADANHSGSLPKGAARATHVGLGTTFVPRKVFDAQCWLRDPGAPKQTNLSDGLRCTLCD